MRLQTTLLSSACVLVAVCALSAGAASITPEELKLVKAAEAARIEAVEKVYGSVVAIYPKSRRGGGSGVVYDSEGFALTNNHVVAPVGEEGLGGLADGKLYKLKLIGTDPGGDVALVRLHGKKPFPTSRLGDSKKVRVGDWCMAMGNPFSLAEDQRPTVTLGVVSGVERYQKGRGNIGVYGNCIQLDTSINPGNSGGPLFNLKGEVVGINGRGSFEERGRVNVGLGYAISLEQIRNFLPDLRAAKICMHGTLDAVFGDRDGQVVCEQINLDSKMAKLGMALGDRLISFEGRPVRSANDFANRVSMLPAHWPVEVGFEHEGKRKSVWLRLRQLPYQSARPRTPQRPQRGRQRQARIKGKPGEIRDFKLNHAECLRILRRWKAFEKAKEAKAVAFRTTEEVWQNGKKVGLQTALRARDGRFAVTVSEGYAKKKAGAAWGWNGKQYWEQSPGAEKKATEGEAALKRADVALMRALAAFGDPKQVKGYKKLVLEGGDKSQNVVADRVCVEDKAGNKVFFWFSLFDEKGDFQTRLLKMGADKDGAGSAPTWALSDYREVAGIKVAHVRRRVSGLNEKLVFEIRVVKCEALEKVPEKAFEAPASAVSSKDNASR